MLEYKLQRSRRKSITISIESDGTVLVKAPLSIPKSQIEQIVERKSDWIASRLEHQKNRRIFTGEEIADYRRQAKQVFPERIHYYEPLLGVQASGIRIKDQKTRWGSCSSKGNINLNWRLILAPKEVMYYVIIHELCHLREMNHSQAFWKLVESICPDYRDHRQWLKDHGDQLGC